MAVALPGPVSASYGPDVWRGHQAQRDIPTLPSGHEKLDRHLPGKGWPLGALTELLTGTAGSGEFSLLLPTLAAIGSQRGWVMMIDPPWVPYPPAMHGHGLALDRLMLIRTRTQKESLWACEQALRGVRGGAILAWQDDPGFARLRRLQLAAKAGHKAAFLFRPISASRQASPAALRLQIHAQEADIQISILKCRGHRHMENIHIRRSWNWSGERHPEPSQAWSAPGREPSRDKSTVIADSDHPGHGRTV
jgi:protein ImuA